MGLLVEGIWQDQWYDTRATGGRFVRRESQFRSWVTADGAPGPSGEGGFRAAAGRYHLYVSLACPWAHRTIIFRKLKGLEDIVGLSVAHWDNREQGWTFEPGPGVIADTVNGARYLHEVYTNARPNYSGRVTVPALWDKERKTIANNESSEIIRMLNSAFDGVGAAPGDYYPPGLRAEIDGVNARVYETLNNGVYRCGFATSQEAYDETVVPLFDTLDWLEARLASHFKCNLRRLTDYPSLWAYTRDLYQHPGVAETVDFDHIKRHYYGSQRRVNPTGIVPRGPILDFRAPHGRERLA